MLSFQRHWGPTMATRLPMSIPMFRPCKPKSSRPGYLKSASISCSSEEEGSSEGLWELKADLHSANLDCQKSGGLFCRSPASRHLCRPWAYNICASHA